MNISPNKSENVLKLLSLLAGILVGGLYANFGRSMAKEWFHGNKMLHEVVPTVKSVAPNEKINETARFLVQDDTTVADSLAESIKVLCWIHANKWDRQRIDAINKTWAARCTEFVLITDSFVNSTNVFNVPRLNKTVKTTTIEDAYRFIYTTYGTKFDWFLKTSDSVYVVMENLRFKLYEYNANEPVAVGLTMTDKSGKYKYLSDKVGYAVNALGLKTMVSGFGRGCLGAKVISDDAVRMGDCMQQMGVYYGKSTDQHNKTLFIDQYIDKFLLPNETVKLPYPWYQDYKIDHNLNALSNYSIIFSDLKYQQIHTMEYLVYDLRAYGIETEDPSLPPKVHFEK